MELLCPNKHKLIIDRIIEGKSGKYALYKCECDKEYIYAPKLRHENYNVKGRQIINLSYGIACMKNGINKTQYNYSYKYHDEKVPVIYYDDSKICPLCSNVTKILDFIIPYNDLPSKTVRGRYCIKCNEIYLDNKYRYQLYKYVENKTLNLEKMHVIRYEGDFENCSQCKHQLKTWKTKYNTSTGILKTCTHLRCDNCNINFIHVNTYELISEHGKNNNIVLDSNEIMHKILLKPAVSSKKVVSTKVVPPKKIDNVYVYKSINITCKKNHLEFVSQVPVQFSYLNDEKSVKTVNAFYCSKCNKKFITMEAISRYTKQMYIPRFNCIPVGILDGFKEVSILTLYGYNVRANGPSTKQRHAIIDYVINNGIMHSAEVVALLESNIKLRKDNLSMADACEKWLEDIEYIYSKK